MTHPRFSFYLAGSVIILSALTAWLSSPVPAPIGAPTPVDDRFVVPPIPVREPNKWAVTLVQVDPWGIHQDSAGGTGQAEAAQKINWNIVGIVMESGQAMAFIRQGEKPSEKRKPGDRLPDDSVITRIREDSISVRRGQTESVLSIYRQ